MSTNSNSEKKNYPNLDKCIVHVPPRYSSSRSGPTSTTLTDTKINPAWIVAAEAPLPELYDFHVEKEVIEREIKDHLADAIYQSTISIGDVAAEDKSNLSLHQRFKLKQLKSITNASESVCIKILQKEDFDLDASIEHYFQNYP